MSARPVAQWSTGPHHAVIWEGGLALLASELTLDAANRLWERLVNVDDLGEFVTALADVAGSGLLDLPDFAVAVISEQGDLHVAARGELMVVADTDDGEVSIDGSNVETWTERQVARVATVVLRGVEQGDEPTDLRWAASGVLPAQTLRSTLFVAPVAPSPAAPEVAVPEQVALEAAPAPGPSEEPEPDGHGEFDGMWGERTMAGSVEAAAVRPSGESEAAPGVAAAPPTPSPPSPAPSPPPSPPAAEPGPPLKAATLFPEDDAEPPTPPPAADERPTPPIEPWVAAPAPPPAQPAPLSPPSMRGPMWGSPPPAEHTGPATVLSVLCPQGHANPPQRARCRSCGGPLDAPPQQVVRPSRGRVVPSSAGVLELTGSVVIGRAPRTERFQGTEMPRLLVLTEAHVSATHLALRVDGWSVMAEDLGSTNGTYLRRDGQPPFRLAGQPHPLAPGDVIDLGHGVQLHFEELP